MLFIWYPKTRSSVILTKSLKKNIKISNHLWRDMQNSDDLFIVEFLASIFGVFVDNLKFLIKSNIVNIFIIWNWKSIITYPTESFVLFSKQK